MLSQMKWARSGLVALMLAALLTGLAWVTPPEGKGKPPKDPEPEPTGPNIKYQVTWLDLGSAFGMSVEAIRTRAINDLGDVCGSLRAEGKLTPFLFTEETGSRPLDDFALPPAGYSSDNFRLLTALGINNHRQIVGYATANGREVAYCLSVALNSDGQILVDEYGAPIPTKAEVLPIPNDALWMDAWDVNDVGDVVCNWKDTKYETHAVVFLFDEETGERKAHDVPVVGDVSYPWHINKDGKVTGTCFVDYGCYALRYDPVTGAIDKLDVPAWGVSTGINGDGQVVGHGIFKKYDSVFISEATGTAVTNLGSLSRSAGLAHDINDAEHILASYRDKSGNYPPCLIVPEYGWLELNSLIAPDDQLAWDAWGESKSVDALNNVIVAVGFGQIAGAAYSSSADVQDAFLLTPVTPVVKN